ncbi:GNAT family N-acetyltransferase [Alkalinema pantanalense CENA528]|uniref:GNAT family N-acetyltransferase n=1 Tax=Alkalinema pantanalense TaxID=1620705 RepID=UPI003D6F3D11
MLIQSLSHATLHGAISVLDRTFPSKTIFEQMSLRACLNRDQFIYRLGFLIAGVQQLNYWVALDDRGSQSSSDLHNSAVMGMIGLYNHQEDADEALWIAMFCVDPAYRGQGIGKDLLNFAINKAKLAGKRYLRLYTSTDPNEAKAQTIYDKVGFRIIDRRPIPGESCDRIYREMDLQLDALRTIYPSTQLQSYPINPLWVRALLQLP